MFYINKPVAKNRKDLYFLHILPTLSVLAVCLAVTFTTWTNSKNNFYEEQSKVTASLNQSTVTELQRRMDSYEEILRGAGGLFYTDDRVTSTDWQTFISVYDIPKRYPGIVGIGVNDLIAKQDLEAYIQNQRDNGYPNFEIVPKGDREIYSSVMYLDRLTNQTPETIGYDMYADSTRREAMDKARDSASATLTRVLTLRQDQATGADIPGFIMYYPIYESSASIFDPGLRRSSITGYSYTPFRAQDLIDATSGSNNFYGFKISSVADRDKPPIYISSNYQGITSDPNSRSVSTQIAVKGQIWSIEGAALPEALNPGIRHRPTLILLSGLFFSLFIAGFIYALLANRARVLLNKEEAHLQNAKDELLALASHQLRTPATGVKQYIGMLKDGLAGKLTPLQNKLINSAYASNERQLSTINQMLLVARADAKQLQMTKRHFDLREVARSIYEEQVMVADKKKQILDINIPTEPVIINGDQQYIRMAMENLVSNASKYTEDDGEITITVSAEKSTASFTVTDNGVGVSKRDMKLLFKKFSRVPNEMTGKVSGSGIGLYLAKKVMDAHHGEIRFTSEDGVGSTVSLIFPRGKMPHRGSPDLRKKSKKAKHRK